MTETNRLVIAIFLGVVVAGFAAQLFGPEPVPPSTLVINDVPASPTRPAQPDAPPAPAPTRPTGDCSVPIEDLSPLVYRIEPSIKSVYVTPLWYTLEIDKKHALVRYFARCHGTPRVRDAKSGKTIARDGLTGVTIDE